MSKVKKFPQEQVETIMAEGEQVLDLACAFGWTRPEPGAPASIELCRTQAAALPITDDGDFTVAKSAALDVLEAIQCRAYQGAVERQDHEELLADIYFQTKGDH